eukprot:COSAG02_NODE_2002_length_10139_cov_4.784761_1_plen_407_part_10
MPSAHGEMVGRIWVIAGMLLLAMGPGLVRQVAADGVAAGDCLDGSVYDRENCLSVAQVLNHGGPRWVEGYLSDIRDICSAAGTDAETCAANSFVCEWLGGDSGCTPSGVLEDAISCVRTEPGEACSEDSRCEEECRTAPGSSERECTCKVRGQTVAAAACEAADPDSCGDSDWFTLFPLDGWCEPSPTENPPSGCQTTALYAAVVSCETRDPAVCTAMANVGGAEREMCAVRTEEDDSICRAVVACANESPNDAGVSAGCFEAVRPYADQYLECESCSPEISSPETVCVACEAAIDAALAPCPPPEPPRCDVHSSVISDIIVPSVCARANATNCTKAVYPFGDAPVPEICAWSGDTCEVSPMMMMFMSMGECGTVSDAVECDSLDLCAWKFDEGRCDVDGAAAMSVS